MKTKEKILKTMATITSLVLFSFTVTAGELWLSEIIKETTKEIAIAMTETDSTRKQVKTEELVQAHNLEKQFNETGFNKIKPEKKKSQLSYQKQVVQGKMISSSSFVFEEDKDSKLQFEMWMFNPEIWKARK